VPGQDPQELRLTLGRRARLVATPQPIALRPGMESARRLSA
jgi:hypothetical protein